TCRQSYEPDPRERRVMGAGPNEQVALFRAVGCEQCDYQGYKGRQGILALLKVDGGIDELVARRATAREILTAARARGFKTLADDGVRLVKAGTTSLDELMRVVDFTDRITSSSRADAPLQLQGGRRAGYARRRARRSRES